MGEDPLTDLALLKLDLTALEGDAALPVAEFGDSDQLEVGDYVMAMGSPFSLSRSVSLGIVSFLIPATLFGLGIGPAVLIHEGSTLIVVFNALRLLAFQDREH